jgi:hypothetical protein
VRYTFHLSGDLASHALRRQEVVEVSVFSAAAHNTAVIFTKAVNTLSVGIIVSSNGQRDHVSMVAMVPQSVASYG